MRKWSNFQKTPCLLQKACYNSPVDERDCRETFRLVFAGVAQLAEHDVANVVVEGSNPFARSYGFVLNPRFERQVRDIFLRA